MDRDTKAFFVGSLLVPAVVWWMFYGRRKYGMKGMR